MATNSTSELFIEEKLIKGFLVWTYPIYFLGGTYLVGSVIGWLILMVILLRKFVAPNSLPPRIPAMVWLWVMAMCFMLLVLWIGHADWYLGMAKTIKSSIGWAKGWALIALFIFVGAVANINPRHVIRGTCIVAFHSMIFAAITFFAAMVKIPGELYISPLQFIGGPGPTFFSVSLYGLNPETGAARWQFFGPWSPAAGMLACLYLVICFAEPDRKWRMRGIMGCLVMCLLTQSRAGWAIFIGLLPVLAMGDNIRHPRFLFTVGLVTVLVLTLGQPVIDAILQGYEDVKNQRPDSTRVRNTLANLALQRWQSEAYWFGHGIVEQGPKIVEGMPIGSHHTWYGLLFVKGLAGMLSLLIPMLISLLYLFAHALFYSLARIAFFLMAVLLGYSFFENLEILVYIFWPALLIIGMAFNPEKLLSFSSQLKEK